MRKFARRIVIDDEAVRIDDPFAGFEMRPQNIGEGEIGRRHIVGLRQEMKALGRDQPFVVKDADIDRILERVEAILETAGLIRADRAFLQIGGIAQPHDAIEILI